jgi:hypothetical protein
MTLRAAQRVFEMHGARMQTGRRRWGCSDAFSRASRWRRTRPSLHNAYVLDVMDILLEAFGRGIAREEPNAALESPLSAPV